MKIIEKNIKDLKPYEKNPRLNDDAVKYVAESIRNFGFKVPIVIDKDNNIVCGHTFQGNACDTIVLRRNVIQELSWTHCQGVRSRQIQR